MDVSFTAIHHALGAPPGPLTDELLDAAVAAGVRETDDLDWKSELPPLKGLPHTDFPKDVAAMANSGGGVIVFGVRESQKAATGRIDVGECDEIYERALRSAAIAAISPPVFGLKVHHLGSGSNRAVVVEVPASVEGPHLIFRNDYFGAPVRNDADTVWMREWQIESMYRARFEERRHATEALDALFTESSRGRDTDERAWLVAVAHPRVPRARQRLTRDDAGSVMSRAEGLALRYAGRNGYGVHPLENVDRSNPRPGLRRWVFANRATGDRQAWKAAWASVHHDGSVTLTAAVGGYPSGTGYLEGWQVESATIECAVADLMALARATAEVTGDDEYDVRVGINWAGTHPLTILTRDNSGGIFDDVSTPLHEYTPVEISVDASEPDHDYHWHVHDLAQDCVNQGGITNLRLIHPPSRQEEA